MKGLVHSRDKDRLVLRIGDAFDIFTIEGENIVMLRTAPARNKERKKSLEAVFSPEWIHEIDSWYQEYQKKILTSTIVEKSLNGAGNGNNGDSS